MPAHSWEALFAFLDGHQLALPPALALALHALALLQWLGFAISDKWAWPLPVGAAQCVATVSHLPVWDTGALCWAYSPGVFLAVHSVAVGVVGACGVVSATLAFSPGRVPAKLRHSLTFTNRLVLRCVVEPLLVPWLRLLLEAHPDHLTLPSFLCGLAALAVLLALACGSRLFLFDPFPDVLSWEARAHGRLHAAGVLVQAVLALVLAVAPAWVGEVCVLLASLGMTAGFWYLQPYYRLALNAVYVAGLLLTAYAAFLAALGSGWGGAAWTASMVAAWGAPFVVALGLRCSALRLVPLVPVTEETLPDYLCSPSGKLQRLDSDAGNDITSEPQSPTSAANQHLAPRFSTTLSLNPGNGPLSSIGYAQSVMTGKSAKTIAGDEAPAVHVLRLPVQVSAGRPVFVGLVRRLLTPFDVELALRFLYLNAPPPDWAVQHVMYFAQVVFAHGLQRYPHSGLVLTQQLFFLAYNQEDTSVVFAHQRMIAKQPMMLDMQYVASQTHSRLLNATDEEDTLVHRHRSAAQKHHRNILLQVAKFWQVLLQGADPDIRRLKALSASIHLHRMAALADFRVLLDRPNPHPATLSLWGRFVETVLGDAEMAKLIQLRSQAVTDSRDASMRSRKSGKDDEVDLLDDGEEENQGLGDVEESTLLLPDHVLAGAGAMAGVNSTAIPQMARSIKIGFTALVLLLVVSCVLFFQCSTTLEASVQRLARAGQVAATAQQSAVWLLAAHFPALADRLDLENSLADLGVLFRSQHASTLTGGAASMGTVLPLYTRPWVPWFAFAGNRMAPRGVEAMNMWDAGYHATDTIDHSSRPGELYIGDAQRSAIANIPGSFGFAMNLTLHATVEDVRVRAVALEVQQAILAAVALFIGLLMYGMYEWSVRLVAVEQLIVLNLFALVPRRELPALWAGSQRQVRELDAFIKATRDVEDIDSLSESEPEEEKPEVPQKNRKKRVGFSVPEDAPEAAKEPSEAPLPEGRPAWGEPPPPPPAGAEATAAAQCPRPLEVSLSAWTQGAVALLLVVQFLAALAGGALVLVLFTSNDQLQTALQARDAALNVSVAARRSFDDVVEAAQYCVQLPDGTRFDAFWAALHADHNAQRASWLAELGGTGAEQVALAKAMLWLDTAASSARVAITLAINATGASFRDYPEVQNLQWDASQEEPVLCSCCSQTMYTTTDQDFRLSRAAQGRLANTLLYGCRLQHITRQAYTQLDALAALADRRTRAACDDVHARHDALCGGALVALGVLMSCLLGTLLLQYRNPLLGRLKAVRYLSVANLLLAGGLMVLLGVAIHTTDELTAAHDWRTAALRAAVRLETRVEARLGLARRFAALGDILAYLDYWDLQRSGAELQLEPGELALGVTDGQGPRLAQAGASLAMVHSLEAIAMVLTVNVYNYPATRFPEVADVQWDLTAEPGAADLRAQFPAVRLWYASRAADLRRPLAEQAALAQAVLSDERYKYWRTSAVQPLRQLQWNVEQRAADSGHRVQTRLVVLSAVLVAGMAVCLGSAVLMALYVVKQLLDWRAQASLDARLRALVGAEISHRKRLKAMLAIPLALLLTMPAFIFAGVFFTATGDQAQDMKLAADLHWLVLRSLLQAERVVSLAGDLTGFSAQDLAADLAALRRVRGALYFGLDPKGNGQQGMRLPQEQAQLIFGANKIDSLLSDWFATAATLQQSNQSDARYVEALHATYARLGPQLAASLERYRQAAQARHAVGRGVDVALAAVVALLIFGLWLAFLAPSIQRLVRVQEGNQSMLVMIPPHIISSVPAIAAHLATASSEAVEVRAEMVRAERLLHNIFPPCITARLKAGEVPIGDLYPTVTLLFTDLVAFTAMSSTVGATELVSLLDSLFCAYDKLAERRGLEKIRTVGDAYIMCGNMLKHPPRVHHEVVEAALEMYSVLQRVNAATGTHIQQRAGVHTGPVIGGVLGHTTLAFDVWGDDVTFASKMESTGLPGKVQMSAATHARVKGAFLVVPREVEVGGVGLVTTYIVQTDPPDTTPRSTGPTSPRKPSHPTLFVRPPTPPCASPRGRPAVLSPRCVSLKYLHRDDDDDDEDDDDEDEDEEGDRRGLRGREDVRSVSTVQLEDE